MFNQCPRFYFRVFGRTLALVDYSVKVGLNDRDLVVRGAPPRLNVRTSYQDAFKLIPFVLPPTGQKQHFSSKARRHSEYPNGWVARQSLHARLQR